MKKLQLLLVALSIVFAVKAQNVNDANAEKRNVGSFHGIHLSSAFDVYLTQGNDEAVAVSASETKWRDRIKTEVKNGILYIGYESEGRWGSGNKKLKAYISFKQLDELHVSGACDVFTSGEINASDLEIKLSGASDLKTKVSVTNKLTVELNGASDITVGGKTTELSVEASGASSFRGFDLSADNCDARASGASDIKITVNRQLSAHATGASDVHYKGEGMIKDLHSSGSSSVSKS
jgi:hypothetical protein